MVGSLSAPPLHLGDDGQVHLDVLVIIDALGGLLEAVLLRVAANAHLAAPHFKRLIPRPSELPAGAFLDLHEGRVTAKWILPS